LAQSRISVSAIPSIPAQLRQFFPTGANDETTLGLDQEILLAGKRNKQIKLAQANVSSPNTSSSICCER
jgi:hypothetical protein